ncbi:MULTISPECIES: acylphosphatase [Clostridium]|uniref:Acylphosphatase n=1 Tax=Clostridium cibarium TaxID=2762247 RepID=A0ABR8PNL9_9CLOT|nr:MULTISPECIES: acylphosphatase [Clostridium]MBD7909758.1 acylphosphatase [Clostridium cibarium]
MVRYFLILEGRVQGVGFRFYAQSNALKYSLTGFVRNMPNGTVELEVQGTENNLQKFISVIREGNRFINVTDFSKKEVSLIQDEKKFRVIY